jgi:hypothetical protein
MKKLVNILCLGAFVIGIAFTGGCSKSDNDKFASLLTLLGHHYYTLFFSDTSTPSYARYGDYLSTQMVTNRTFGYGMFICEFRAADGPTCSTFWLYSNEPSVKNLPDVAQNWRWNEVDFEFVPHTKATQSQYYTFNGGLPNPTEIKKFGTSLNFGDSRAKDLADTAVSWTEGKFQTDDIIARDMINYYNLFLTQQKSGTPTGGTFTLKDALTGDSTTLPWNATQADVQNALNALNHNKGLFNMKDKYNVVVPQAGGFGDILDGSRNIIRNIDPGLTPQLYPGLTVTDGNSIIPNNTTIISVDKDNNTVTLSQNASEAASHKSFSYFGPGDWLITFTPDHPDSTQALVLDYSLMEPAGVFGEVLVGKDTTGIVTNMHIYIFKPYLKPAGVQTWWDLLTQNTPLAGAWADATQWKYPLVHIPTPSGLDIGKMVTLNFWRSPAGNESRNIDFGSWGNPVTHTGILREKPIAGTAGYDNFTSAVLNNEAYVFDSTGDYDPTSQFHTYTIVWTRTRMAQYIDAPDRGRDISNATPIAEYKIADFPSLDHSGPRAPGANIPWIGTQLNQPIGNVTMNVANYVAFQAASTGPNNYAYATGTLTNGQTVVTNLSIQDHGNPKVDLKNKGISGEGIQPGTTITDVDPAGTTLTLSAAASSTNKVSLTMGLDVQSGTFANAITLSIPGLDKNKVAVGQLVLGPGIPAGTKVKIIGDDGVSVTIDQTATVTAGTMNFVFQTIPSGNGWSGPPPGASFNSADAYVRSVGFFPLIDELLSDGSATSDFLLDTTDPKTFWVDFTDDTIWTTDTFSSLITKYFSILYAQDFTSDGAIPGITALLRDAKSPMNVTYLPPLMAGSKGCMRLRCSPSTKNPVRNFFVLQPKQAKDKEINNTDNPLIRAEIASIDDPEKYYAASSSVTSPSAFYAPPLPSSGEGVDATVKVWVSTKGYYDPIPTVPLSYNDPAPDYTAEITLFGASDDGKTSCHWTVKEDCHKVIADFQSANPHLITVQSPTVLVCP